MRLVQLLLTTEQAAKVEAALKFVVGHPDVVMEEAEAQTFTQLTGLFQSVVDNPTAFPPRGEMSRTVKSIVRRVKGPAQPTTVAPKRSQGQQKRDRAARREYVQAYNEARARIEKELEEAA